MRSYRQAASLAAIVALVLSACGGAGAPAAPAAATAPTPAAKIQEIAIKATEYAYEIPQQIEAGLNLLAFENAGKLPHNLAVLRLRDGVTFDQFKEALSKGRGAFRSLIEPYGGATRAQAGQRRQVVLDLAEGEYAVFSSVPGEDKAPDFAKGMLRSLRVTARTGKAAPEPAAEISIALRDATPIPVPATVSAGKQTWRFTHEGADTLSTSILKLAAGKTLDDVSAWFKTQSGPEPFDWIGGVIAFGPGRRAWVVLDLAPGEYVAYDDAPSDTRAKPATFSVR